MPHSISIEEHAQQKLNKTLELLKSEGTQTPLYAELWLKANKQHPHHAAELHLKTPHLDLHSHDEGTDMYMVIDTAIEKMLTLVKKEKERQRDKIRKPQIDKRIPK
jgi:ribosomal subunit interface protein